MAKNVVTLAKTRFEKHNFVIFQPKETREIGCHTEPVSTKHAAGQANIKILRRSKSHNKDHTLYNANALGWLWDRIHVKSMALDAAPL